MGKKTVVLLMVVMAVSFLVTCLFGIFSAVPNADLVRWPGIVALGGLVVLTILQVLFISFRLCIFSVIYVICEGIATVLVFIYGCCIVALLVMQKNLIHSTDEQGVPLNNSLFEVNKVVLLPLFSKKFMIDSAVTLNMPESKSLLILISVCAFLSVLLRILNMMIHCYFMHKMIKEDAVDCYVSKKSKTSHKSDA